MKNLKKFYWIILSLFIYVSCEEKPVPPVVSTNAVTEVSGTSAVSGGKITDEGGAPVIARGVCWNTSDNPTLDNNFTSNEGLSFSSSISQLSPRTMYYVRAYATNSAGTGYGEPISFTTLGDKPVPVSVSASGITINSATLNGIVNPNSLPTTISFDWGTTVSYGQNASPEQNTVTGAGPVNIMINLTSLSPGTTYHFRINATNELGTAHGDNMSFTTLGQVPSASATVASGIGLNTAKINGVVNPNHLSTTVSFEWGTTVNYGNSITPVQNQADGSTPVDFSADLSGLTPGTTYHYRITATNQLGSKSSEDMIFSTNISDSESNIYRTVTIGNQLWLAENLKATKYNDGTSIQLVEANDQWNSAGNAAYSWYNNDPLNKNDYGGYYNWYVVDQSMNGFKNICPAGWHIPKKSEWTVLFSYLSQNGYSFDGITDAISKSMASTSGWESAPSAGLVGNDQPSNNKSGFNGFPAGLRIYNGSFSVFGRWAGWWNQPDAYMASYSPWYSVITHDTKKVETIGLGFNYGASIRCIKD